MNKRNWISPKWLHVVGPFEKLPTIQLVTVRFAINDDRYWWSYTLATIFRHFQPSHCPTKLCNVLDCRWLEEYYIDNIAGGRLNTKLDGTTGLGLKYDFDVSCHSNGQWTTYICIIWTEYANSRDFHHALARYLRCTATNAAQFCAYDHPIAFTITNQPSRSEIPSPLSNGTIFPRTGDDIQTNPAFKFPETLFRSFRSNNSKVFQTRGAYLPNFDITKTVIKHKKYIQTEDFLLHWHTSKRLRRF